ncbi:hypothetical protein O181_073921 [Austropuccinia psidii MF-1]|uniref:Reverse transcriptase domain-containing protein n=1 Tax=Austropuccinia psidii MF-1 TaxID=1389203 RepID=A0A9Q3I8R3_9BASI|nr:hypothetical protein [Austropuccinia psidii MF-1]
MGVYEYTRMPFGNKNAPAHLQRVMDTIFQEEILEGWMVVYIDDIIIYSETWEDHVQYIDRVLRKCTPINLKISLKKCNFGQQELLALGNKVSGLSLAIDQNKVTAILQKPVPKSIKEVQSFLGFASYYRNHIKNFAHITSSLYTSCSKDVVFQITKERRDSYERIKHELTNAPVLILPEFKLPVTTMAIHLLGSPYGISSHSPFMANWAYPSPVANMAKSSSYGPFMAICLLGPSWPFTSIQKP